MMSRKFGQHLAKKEPTQEGKYLGFVPKMRDEVESSSVLKSPEGTEYVSPGRSPGSRADRKIKALKGRNMKAPPDLFRPFRAPTCLPICSQGVALGFLMTPRWGLSFWTLIVCDSFSASGTHVLEADLSTLGQSQFIENQNSRFSG